MTDLSGAPIGVSTRYLQRVDQLGLELWHVRAFVAAAHRRTTAATALAVGAREHLEEAFVSGRDTRAPGMAMEIENAACDAVFPEMVWNEVDVVLVGKNARGDELRVYYFAGARLR